jgi:hypothetical protein
MQLSWNEGSQVLYFCVLFFVKHDIYLTNTKTTAFKSEALLNMCLFFERNVHQH